LLLLFFTWRRKLLQPILLMANTYTEIHFHVVFVVKFREALIKKSWRDDLCKYITGTIQNHDHKMISIFAMDNHVHMLFGYRPTQLLPDLMRIVKGESSEWINKRKLTTSTFRWQSGYAAIGCSKSHIPRIARYIENQEAHHQKVDVVEECKELLTEAGIAYDERYIFHLPL
jgi:putative transposase